MNQTVLIVDDSLTVRMDLTEALQAEGLETIACESATAARAALAERAIGLVILDVRLPDADGVDLLKEIRAGADGARLPVLMLSTESDVRDRIRGLMTGSDEYVGKPYHREHVVARARELLQQSQVAEGTSDASILVIDDSATFREALAGALQAQGYRVLTSPSGEDGLRQAAANGPTAIVVDEILPGIEGAAVVRKLRLDAALRHTPCVLLTGSDDRGAELRALEAGADAFVRKDEPLEVVLARVAAVVRNAQSLGHLQETASLLSPKKILAVDDSRTFLEEISDILRTEGYDVIPARSGEEALEMLAVQPVDCILLDRLMPDMDGTETCRRIKASPTTRDIPLIMLTAMEDREAMIEGLGTGADDYVLKSSETEVLKARVRAQLRRKQFEDETRRIREQLLNKEIEATEARAAKALAETKAAMAEELERRNRELEAFSYSVSHDLRAPLRSIDGFSRILLDQHADRLDVNGHDCLERIRRAAQRMGELIDDLLTLSRITRVELRCEQVDLSALARDVAETLQRQDAARQGHITVANPVTARGDPRLLRIVLENLLGNAWKFTSHVTPAEIEFGQESDRGDTVYFVRDNGAGFDMAYAEKLFAPFQRLHSMEEFPGTGIGLATVQRIIHKHRGSIWAQGVVDQGATFFFKLGTEAI